MKLGNDAYITAHPLETEPREPYCADCERNAEDCVCEADNTQPESMEET